MPIAKIKEQDDLAADFKAIMLLMKEREWSELCNKSPVGKKLEFLITEMHNETAELQQKLGAMAAENAALKDGPHGFFAYDSGCGYEEFQTAKQAQEFAETSISEYRGEACDGWPDEVGSVVWGVIVQRATMTGLRPIEEGDNCAEGIDEWCDYALLPSIQNPATDAYMNSVRMEGRYEGINYAAGRLAAAFNHGFVDKPKREVFDVVRMILSAKEDLSDDPQISQDGLSGEYAEKSLKEWEEELISGTHDTADKAG